MVDTPSVPRSVTTLVATYVVLTLATLVALGILSGVDAAQAGQDAWVHAAVVAAFAALLPLRLRAARAGSRRAGVAVVVIAGVLAVANVLEAVLPGLFPSWMRVEMLATAVVMVAVVVLCVRHPAPEA